jgi:hypothetical protein
VHDKVSHQAPCDVLIVNHRPLARGPRPDEGAIDEVDG